MEAINSISTKKSYSIIALSITNFTLRIFLQGLIPIYPFIIGKMTTKASAVGTFLSLNYVFLLLGTYLTGIVVPKRIKPKTILLISIIPVIIALYFYGIINDILIFYCCGCFLSFFVGIHICSNNIMMGFYSSQTSLGKNFSVLSISSLLATIGGGFIIGPLMMTLGYKIAFLAFSSTLLIFSLLLFPLVQPKIITSSIKSIPFKIDKKLWLLLLFNFLISLLSFGFKLSISIMLKKRGWNISNISIMMALGTSFAIPITLWWGKISRYKNAVILLQLTVLFGFISYLTLLGNGIYLFGLIGFGCISIVAYSIVIPLMKIIFEWFDHNTLPKAQSLLSSSTWFSAIVGFYCSGMLSQYCSEITCISIGLVIAIFSIIPLFIISNIKNS